MKRAALALAVLSIAILAGCGAGDAGRWIVDTSLRSAYGCSLLVSSDQTAQDAGDVAQRPAPLRVRDRAIVLGKSEAERAPVVSASLQTRSEEPVEIAAVPISRDLSSIRGKGTRSERALYRFAENRAPRIHVRVARPLPPPSPSPISICPSARGYRG